MRSISVRSALFLALGAACACTVVDSPEGPGTGIVPVDRLKVVPQSLVLPSIGATATIVATLGPVDATDREVVWESSDSTIVSVDARGVVTARAPGAGVFVTAYSHDRSRQASANVTVAP